MPERQEREKGGKKSIRSAFGCQSISVGFTSRLLFLRYLCCRHCSSSMRLGRRGIDNGLNLAHLSLNSPRTCLNQISLSFLFLSPSVHLLLHKLTNV